MASVFETYDRALSAFERGERHAAIEALRRLLDDLGPHDAPPAARSEVARQLASFLERTGEVAEAQSLRRSALAELEDEGLGGEWFAVVLEGDLGRGFEAIGQMDRATSAWEHALASLRRASWDKPHVKAMTLLNATVSSIHREAWEEAEARAAEAVAACQEAGPAAGDLLCRARLSQETIERARGRRAASALAAPTDAVPPGGGPRVLAALNRLASLAREGRLGEGLDALESVLEDALPLGAPLVDVRYWTSLARLRRLAGRGWGDVISAARQAVDRVEALRGPLGAFGFSPGALRSLATDAYELLAIGLLAQGRTAEAFDVLERSRARTLLDDLRWGRRAGGRTRMQVEIDALRDEIRRMLGRLTCRGTGSGRNIAVVACRPQAAGVAPLPGAPAPPPLDPGRASLKDEQLVRAQERHAGLLRDAAGRPEEAGEPFTVASLEAVQAVLGEDELLLETTFLGTHLVTLAIRRDGVERTASAVDGGRLAALVDACRKGLADPSSATGPLEEGLERLGSLVLGPVAERLDRFRTVVWSPAGPLADVPLAALRSGGRYLGSRVATATLPLASFLVEADRRPRPGPLLALGNPDHADPLLALPRAEAEVEAIGRLYPGRVAVRDEASAPNLRRFGAGAGVLHLACHALFDRDHPGFSLLRLAPATEDGAGLVLASDVPGLGLECALVVLSACQAGLSRVVDGCDLGGLAAAFLTSGGRSVVAGLWSVDDAATERLMVAFYGQLRHRTKADALRAACHEVASDPRTSHPAYWAPFVLMGDFRGRVAPAALR